MIKNNTKQNKKRRFQCYTPKCAHKGGDGNEIGVKHILHQLQQTQSTAGQVHIVQKPQHNLQENLQDEEWKIFITALDL